MKKVTIVLLVSLIFTACNIMRYSTTDGPVAKHFKTEIPFTVEKDMAIVVPLRVGTNNDTYRFHFDTHALESGFETDGHLYGSTAIKYAGSSSLKIKTTMGEKIDREYYNADTVFLGNVLISKAAFFKMPADRTFATDTTFPKFDGLLGVSLMRDGVWKIDFVHNIITFASNMDSLKGIDDKILFAKSNVFDIFKTEAVFNDLRINLAVDLGASSNVLLPLDEMKKLKNFKLAARTTKSVKTAAGTSEIERYQLTNEKATINNHTYNVKVDGTKTGISILGLNFFRQFKYIIIDYPAGKMYVSASSTNS